MIQDPSPLLLPTSHYAFCSEALAALMDLYKYGRRESSDLTLNKNLHTNCRCASLLGMQIHMLHHASMCMLSNKMSNDRTDGQMFIDYGFVWELP